MRIHKFKKNGTARIVSESGSSFYVYPTTDRKNPGLFFSLPELSRKGVTELRDHLTAWIETGSLEIPKVDK